MGDYAKPQRNNVASSRPEPARASLRSRPFAPETAHAAPSEDWQAQVDRAERFGFSLANLVSRPGGPAPGGGAPVQRMGGEPPQAGTVASAASWNGHTVRASHQLDGVRLSPELAEDLKGAGGDGAEFGVSSDPDRTAPALAAEARAGGSERAWMDGPRSLVVRGVSDLRHVESSRSLEELGSELSAQAPFRKFRARKDGTRLKIEGKINPWINLLTGETDSMTPGPPFGIKTDPWQWQADPAASSAPPSSAASLPRPSSVTERSLRSRTVPPPVPAVHARSGHPSMRSIYSSPATPATGLEYLAEAAQHQQQGVGMFYGGPVDVLHAPPGPIAASVPPRRSADTAAAFQEATGDPSARAHMERHGYPSGPHQHHRTHVGGYGQHGPAADNPGNIGAATAAANGEMIPTDNRYPPGFIDLNEAEVEPDSHVMHRIHQGVAHPDAPQIPLFRHTVDAFRGSLTHEEWDQQDSFAQRMLTPDNLNAAHSLQLLNPAAHPSMSQIREREELERTAMMLDSLRYPHGHDAGDGSDDDEKENG